MLTDKLIFAGVQFNHTKDYHTEDFDKTDIKTFMDKYLSKELEQTKVAIEVGEQSDEEREVQPSDEEQEIQTRKIKSR